MLRFLNLHDSFADICARFADICARFALRFLLAPFDLGGPTGPVLGKTLEAGKSVRLPYFGDDPWFCNTFGLRAEIYVTKGAPGREVSPVSLPCDPHYVTRAPHMKRSFWKPTPQITTGPMTVLSKSPPRLRETKKFLTLIRSMVSDIPGPTSA